MTIHTTNDEAIQILQGSNDGNDLSSSDLALVEAVVNYGKPALSKKGVEHWESLLNAIKTGTYQRQWLYGVENVTKDPQGNVFWRQLNIEHYSGFDSPEAEKLATINFGASCRWLEANGIEVSLRNLFSLWDRIRWASDIKDAPKWAAFFTANKTDRILKIVYLGSSGEPNTLQNAVHATLEALDPNRNGSFVSCRIASKEDLLRARDQIHSHFQWAQRAFHSSTSETRDAEDRAMRHLLETIDEASLPTDEQSRNATFGEGWASVGLIENQQSSPQIDLPH